MKMKNNFESNSAEVKVLESEESVAEHLIDTKTPGVETAKETIAVDHSKEIERAKKDAELEYTKMTEEKNNIEHKQAGQEIAEMRKMLVDIKENDAKVGGLKMLWRKIFSSFDTLQDAYDDINKNDPRKREFLVKIAKENAYKALRYIEKYRKDKHEKYIDWDQSKNGGKGDWVGKGSNSVGGGAPN